MELEYVSIGRWVSTDGKFAVIKKPKPINPMESSEIPAKNRRHTYSIRDLRERDYAGTMYEMSPEIGCVDTFKEIVPFVNSLPAPVSESKGMLATRSMRVTLLG